MKKFTAFIIAFFYLFTSSGVMVNLHYCMGKVVDYEIWTQTDKGKVCKGCGMVKEEGVENDCCKDDYKQIKHDKHQLAGKVQFTAFASPKTCQDFALQLSLFTVLASNGTRELFFKDYPPPKHTVPIFIFNRILRI